MLNKILLYLLVFYGFVGFVILPLVLKPQLVEIIEKETNSQINIDSVSFNPFIFRLELSGVELKSLDNKALAAFKSLQLDIELYSLLNSAIHIKELILEEPKLTVVYNKDKTINLLGILKEKTDTPPEPSDEKTTPPRIILDRVALINGFVSYEDYTLQTKFDFSFGNIGFELKDIDTNDFNTSDAELRFYSRLGDGGFVDFKSKVVGFKPFVFNGSLDFEASKLYTQWKYMQDSLNLEVADGKISFHTEYHLNLDNLDETSIDNLSVSLNKLRIKPKSKYKDVLNLDSLYLANATIKPMQQNVHINTIGISSLAVKAKREKDGVIDWLEYIKINALEDNNKSVETHMESNTTSPAWNLLVDDILLEKIAVDFNDEAVHPVVLSRINELNFYVKDFTLSGKKSFTYDMNVLMNDAFKCNSKGSIAHNILNIETDLKCSGFDIAHYRPYIDEAANKELKVYDLQLLNALLDFNAKVNVEDVDEGIAIRVNDANASLSKFAIDKRSTKERVVDFNTLKIDGIELDTLEKSLNVQKVSLSGLDIKTARLADGTLSIDNIIVAKDSKPSQKAASKTKDEKEYSVNLKHFALDAAKLTFHDKALTPNVKSKIDRIFMNIYDIDAAKRSWLKYRLYMRINSKGIIRANGNLRHTPLKQKGTLDIQNLSLVELTPYLQEKAFVKLTDGKLSLKSKVAYEASSKSPDLRVSGLLNVKDFFVNDSRDNSSLLSFNNLGLKSFTFELFPNRLYIDEIDLDAFYVNAKIDENKQMNFAKLIKQTDVNSAEQREELKTQKEDTNASKEAVFPVTILKMNVAMGSAEFEDFSIPIKFKTNIHDLNGVIYSISSLSGETTYLNIDGEVDKYGSTKLKGSINSANPKEFTDLDFNFKNLELSSLSGYSASFAGHEIDSGKLFLDLGYDIKNSELLGSNNVMIKQIKLGREIEDENITSLPLGFVIALLEDNEGIIEIDMPVEGNLDQPDFKYGALVLKTLGNLIVKAVTSPFTFLGSMMGIDGDALEFAEFEKGSNAILPPEREKLDQIAKMMTKRPKINLSLSPTYDEQFDKRALQTQKLIDLVVKESGIKNKKDHETVMTTDMLEDIYKDAKDDDVLDNLEEKLEKEYKDDEFDRAYFSALLELCKDIQVVTKLELENLAKTRAEVMLNYLVQEKNIEVNRVILAPITFVHGADDKLVKQKLTIKVK